MSDRRTPFEEMTRLLEEMRRSMSTSMPMRNDGPPSMPMRDDRLPSMRGRRSPAVDGEDGRRAAGMPGRPGDAAGTPGRFGDVADAAAAVREDAGWMDSAGAGTNLTVEETDGGYAVVADMPGFETDEIDLRFDDGTLTVRAEHDVTERDGSTTTRRRRSVFERVGFPAGVVESGISASYRNGVLEVDLPVADDGDPDSRIEID